MPKSVMTDKILSKCYELLRQDIELLYQKGIKVMYKNKEETVFAKLTALSADNEMANHIFALGGSFIHGQICRFCTATAQFIQEFVYYEEDWFDHHRQEILDKDMNLPRLRTEVEYGVGIEGVKRYHPFYNENGQNIPIHLIQTLDLLHDVIIKAYQTNLFNLTDFLLSNSFSRVL